MELARPWLLRPRRWLDNLPGDLFGGITAGVVALPLALAFGVASGLGPAAGLYGAIVVGVVAAALGGTPSQVSGPTGPMTVVVAGVVATASGQPGLVVATLVLAGVLMVLFGATRLGVFIRYVPYPVVSGFMTGIGVIIIALQLLPLLGGPGASGVLKSLAQVPAAVAQLNPAALALGLAAIAIVYGTKRVAPRLPGALVALVSLTVVAALLRLEVPLIGAIPTGLPAVQLPPLDPTLLAAALPAAVTLAALGSIDSLLTSLVADNLTRTRHDSNQELIGQGLGNTLAALVGGVPGAGATMRTVVNIQAGGRTGLSGVVHGLVLLLILVALAPLAAHIPLPVLAGILVTVGLGIVDLRALRHFARVPRADALIMSVVLVMTVLVDLIQAVGVGMVMASLVFMKRMSDLEVGTPAEAAEAASATQVGTPAPAFDDLWVVSLHGPLFFGNALRLHALVMGLDRPRGVVLDLRETAFLDQSAAYALSDLALDLRARGARLVLAGLGSQPARVLRLTGIAPGELPEAQVVPTPDEGLAWLRARPSSPP
ncbi:MAG: SulP family inorganic anion transporter [Candidatus Sericytochromatia bacterium]|nr:SulP family inorganic anion transporter [Candidatus Sericytochromatia bacterium]